MDRREFLGRLGTGAVGLAAGSVFLANAGGRSRRQPNVVFFLVDDMGWMDVGCNGSTFFDTPNIDKLAAAGMRFTDGYAACPVCSPTRASIMAGKYPARMHLTDWLVGSRWPKKSPLTPVKWCHALPLGEVTIAEALKSAGYATCHVGKWHLGHPKKFWPEHQGFDENFGGTWSGMPKSYYYPAWAGNPPIKGRPGQYLTDRLTEGAIDFIDRHRAQPFFLHLAHYGVHTPIQGKTDYMTKYRFRAGREKHQTNAIYGAMVQSIDDSVGRVVAKLEELGLSDDTVIIFTSDNGGLSTPEGAHTPATSNHPLRAGKGHLYEGGIREPWIVKWPGQIKAGTTCAEPVSSVDFYPTILALTGVKAPALQVVDGLNLSPLLRQRGKLERSAIFWHYPHYSNQGGSPGSAVRAGDWKLIKFWEDERLELYNLKTDISETTNLASIHPEQTKRLHGLLTKWLANQKAQVNGRRVPLPG